MAPCHAGSKPTPAKQRRKGRWATQMAQSGFARFADAANVDPKDRLVDVRSRRPRLLGIIESVKHVRIGPEGLLSNNLAVHGHAETGPFAGSLGSFPGSFCAAVDRVVVVAPPGQAWPGKQARHAESY